MTRQEADSQNIKYKPWREVEVGEYALCDDEEVLKCVSKRFYRNAYYMRFENGTDAWSNQKKRFLGRFKENWVQKELRCGRAKILITAYVHQLLEGNVDWDFLGRLYRSDQKIPAATARRFLKQEEVQQVVREELRKVLESRGINEGFVLDLYKQAIEMARTKKDVTNLLRAAENLRDILDMLPARKNLQASFSAEYVLTPEQERALLREAEYSPVQPPERQLEEGEELSGERSS